MAKELPYFRFTVQDWQNGDINLESYELKGLFIDVCAYYWMRDCIVTVEHLDKKFSNALALLKHLYDLNIIKLKTDKNDNEFVCINFLDEQLKLLLDSHKKRSEAGRIGGLKKFSNAKAMLKQCSSYKDKDNNKDNNKDNYLYLREKFIESVLPEFKEIVLEWINYKKSKKQTYKNEKSLQLMYKKLLQLSENNPLKAKAIINEAMANNYSGFYDVNRNIECENTEQSWRNDKNMYVELINKAYNDFVNNTEWFAEQQRLNPRVDLPLTFEKAYKNFFKTNAGWIYLKEKYMFNEIDWQAELLKAIKNNRIFENK